MACPLSLGILTSSPQLIFSPGPCQCCWDRELYHHGLSCPRLSLPQQDETNCPSLHLLLFTLKLPPPSRAAGRSSERLRFNVWCVRSVCCSSFLRLESLRPRRGSGTGLSGFHMGYFTSRLKTMSHISWVPHFLLLWGYFQGG